MPIYKYRSLEEAEKHLHELLPSDPLKRLLDLEGIVTTLLPRKKTPKGLFRFKTFEEANAHRKATLG